MSLQRGNEIREFESVIRKAKSDLKEALARIEEMEQTPASQVSTGEMHQRVGLIHTMIKNATYPSLSFINRN